MTLDPGVFWTAVVAVALTLVNAHMFVKWRAIRDRYNRSEEYRRKAARNKASPRKSPWHWVPFRKVEYTGPEVG